MAEVDDTEHWLSGEAKNCLGEIGVKAGQTVLDFGCGRGRYSIPAAEVVGCEGKLYAADKNAATLETLDLWASALGLNQVDTFNTHGEVRTPLEKESVDAVLLHDVLHLIGWERKSGRITKSSTRKDRKSLLDEMFRITKCNGILSVFCPHLATHTDVTTEYAIIQEIIHAGFRLEREMYRKIMHDDRLQHGHLCRFSKTCAETEIDDAYAFFYDSPAFQTGLKKDRHHFGEVLMLTAFVEPGMLAVELGANRGVTTVALARSVGSEGQVHTFEPVPEYYAALVENLRRNGVKNTQIHQLAITNKEGIASYYKHGEGSGIVKTDQAKRIVVGTTSIDRFARSEHISEIDFINMDCEGAELLALQGASRTLRNHAPRIFCEIHHDYLSRLGQSVDDIVAYLDGFGFRVMPLRVEALGEKVELGYCTHLYAVKDEPLPDVKSLVRHQQKKKKETCI